MAKANPNKTAKAKAAVGMAIEEGEVFAPEAEDTLEDLQGRLKDLDRHIAQCNAERAALVAECDALIVAQEEPFDPHANQKAIIRALKSDHANRAAHIKEYQELAQDNPDIKFRKPIAPIDATLQNRRRTIVASRAK